MAQYGGYDQSGYSQGNRYNQQAGNPYAQSGNPYSQQQSNPYAQQQPNPYAQQQGNTYGQQSGNPYGQQPGNPYAQQNSQPGAYGVASNDIEMGHVNGQASAEDNERALLNEISEIDRALNSIQDRNIPAIRSLQLQVLSDTSTRDDTNSRKQLDALEAETMAALRNFTNRIVKIKGKPGAGGERTRPQIRKTQDRVQADLNAYLNLQNEYRKKCVDQIARNMRNQNSNVTEQEIQEAIDGGIANTGVYTTGLQQSNRRGEVATVLRANQDRSNEIRNVEKSLAELAELMQQLNATIVEQGEMTERIQEQVEDTEKNTRVANNELSGAVTSARAARKKKWICFWICVAVIIIVALIVGIYVGINNKK